MIAKLVIIVVASISAVVGVFFLGKFMDRGSVEGASAEEGPGVGV
ncbi:MAG: hypothetical protein ACI4RD_01550 [Kiritimatiellia bacterium]